MNAKPSHEDQFVAALCHASLLVPLLGMMIPMVVWLTQRQRSPFLRLQALQALFYQLAWLLLYALLYVCQLLATFGAMAVMVAGALSAGLPSGSDSNAFAPLRILAVIIFMFVYVVAMGINLLQCVLVPLYAAGGLWAGVRVLGGHDFRYPLLGRLVKPKP